MSALARFAACSRRVFGCASPWSPGSVHLRPLRCLRQIVFESSGASDGGNTDDPAPTLPSRPAILAEVIQALAIDPEGLTASNFDPAISIEPPRK